MNAAKMEVSIPVPVAEFPGGVEAVNECRKGRRRAGTAAKAVALATFAALIVVFLASTDALVAAVVASVGPFVFFIIYVALDQYQVASPAEAPVSEVETHAALRAAGVPGPVAALAASLADEDRTAPYDPWPRVHDRLVGDGSGDVTYLVCATVVGPRIVDVGGEPAKLEVSWTALAPTT